MSYCQQIYYINRGNRRTYLLDNWSDNYNTMWHIIRDHALFCYQNSRTFRVKIWVLQGLQTGNHFKISQAFYTKVFSTLSKFQTHIGLLLKYIQTKWVLFKLCLSVLMCPETLSQVFLELLDCHLHSLSYCLTWQ